MSEARYFTGKPCRHGHVAERMVCNGVCVECKKNYKSSYKLRHPERRAAEQRRWLDRRDNRRRHNQRKEEKRKKGLLALKALQELGIEV